MATISELQALRLLIAEPTEDSYNDVVLSERLDAVSGDLDRLAYAIWTEKAAAYSALVDVSESGSSRKLGDLHKNALAMREAIGARVSEADSPTQTGVRIGRIVRR